MPGWITPDRSAALFVAAAVTLATLPLFATLDRLPARGDVGDAYQSLAILHCAADAARRFGEIPAWNPMFGGGIPWAGHPVNPGHSPVVAIHVALGEIAGQKVAVWAYLLIGSWGVYATARGWFSLTAPASTVAALVYALAGWTPGRLVDGNHSELPLLLLPAVIALSRAFLDRRRIGFFAPIAYLAVIAEARYGFLVFAPVSWLIPHLRRRDAGFTAREIALAAVLPFAFGVAFAAPKLLPLVELLERDLVDQTSQFAVHSYPTARIFLESLVGENRWIARHTIGIGWGALGVALVGAVARPRAALPCGLALAAAAAVSIEGWLPLASVARELPVIGTVRDFVKYANVVVLFAAALLAGLGADVLGGRATRRGARTLAYALVLAATSAEPFLASSATFATLYRPLDRDVAKQPFTQAAAVSTLGVRERVRGPEYAPWQYWNVRRNVGTIGWYGLVVLEERAVPEWLLHPDGRLERNPEARPFLEAVPHAGGSCELVSTRTSYETISFRADGDCERVIVNTNHDPRWRTDRGRVVEDRGLLAVELEGTSAADVRLRFVDPRYEAGKAIAAIALVVWTWIVLRRRARG